MKTANGHLTVSSMSMPTQQEVLSVGGVTPENAGQVSAALAQAMQAKGYAAYGATNNFGGQAQSAQIALR